MDTVGVPHKISLRLEKYGPGKDPAIDEPDDVIVTDGWYEADGEPVTDPARIAELDAGESGKEGSAGD